MVFLIRPDAFLAVAYAKEDSDLHAINNRLTERFAMSLRDSNADPREYAAHCLSAFLSHAYEGTEISGTGEIERAVNLSPNTLAGNYWITRIKRNLPGSQQRDWELALETFVNACLSHYGKPELQDRAAA